MLPAVVARMPLPWTQISHSRKYVDLLFRETNPMIASVDPSSTIEVREPAFSIALRVEPLQVGDYGSLDPRTGRFIKEGDIFTLSGMANLDLTTIVEPTKDYLCFREGTAKFSSFNVEGSACVFLFFAIQL